jgi:hypothetical protein
MDSLIEATSNININADNSDNADNTNNVDNADNSNNVVNDVDINTLSSTTDKVLYLSNNFNSVVNFEIIKKYNLHSSTGNGCGDRIANKKFNYITIYSNGSTK